MGPTGSTQGGSILQRHNVMYDTYISFMIVVVVANSNILKVSYYLLWVISGLVAPQGAQVSAPVSVSCSHRCPRPLCPALCPSFCVHGASVPCLCPCSRVSPCVRPCVSAVSVVTQVSRGLCVPTPQVSRHLQHRPPCPCIRCPDPRCPHRPLVSAGPLPCF